MFRPLLATLALSLSLAACASSAPAGPAPEVGGCVASAPETMAPLVGDWMTTDRWDVHLRLFADGRAFQDDWISPCPPNARCVWSGVAINEGRWSLDGDVITLSWPKPDTTHDVTLVTALRIVRCGDRLELVDASGHRYAGPSRG